MSIWDCRSARLTDSSIKERGGRESRLCGHDRMDKVTGETIRLEARPEHRWPPTCISQESEKSRENSHQRITVPPNLTVSHFAVKPAGIFYQGRIYGDSSWILISRPIAQHGVQEGLDMDESPLHFRELQVGQGGAHGRVAL